MHNVKRRRVLLSDSWFYKNKVVYEQYPSSFFALRRSLSTLFMSDCYKDCAELTRSPYVQGLFFLH